MSTELVSTRATSTRALRPRVASASTPACLRVRFPREDELNGPHGAPPVADFCVSQGLPQPYMVETYPGLAEVGRVPVPLRRSIMTARHRTAARAG
jgi:hypothetical protein